MTRDELEFSISQYLDGGLAGAQRDALENRLATDVEARAVFAEYQSLQGALAGSPLPDVRWDKLAGHISAAVAREEMPAQSFNIARWMRPARLAIAASVLLAAGIGFALLKSDDAGPDRSPAAPTRIVRVDAESPAPVAAVVDGQPIQIAIGPSRNLRDEPAILLYADSVVRRPSKALIVSAVPAGQNSPMTPF